MEVTQETNIETPHAQASPETECKKIEKPIVPELTSEELYNKILGQVRQCLHKSSKNYQTPCIQAIFNRSNYKLLSDLQLHCLVIEVRAFFNENKRMIHAQMATVRFYHEMIVHLERSKTYIAGVFPIIFVETLGNVKDENMFYFVKELKALYRIWHGYMDMLFLRKIRDQCKMSCQTEINDINLADKYLVKELSKIRHSQYVAQKIITANSNGLFPISPVSINQRQNYRTKFKFWRKKNGQDKDETLSNQTNCQAEQKEKVDFPVNEVNEAFLFKPEQRSAEQIHNRTNSNKQQQQQNTQQKVDKNQRFNQKKEKVKGNENKKIKKHHKVYQSEKNEDKDKATDEAKKTSEASKDYEDKNNCGDSEKNIDKISKLKELYSKMMMSKNKKVGNKVLVQSGTWQFCVDVIQTLREKIFKKDIERIISAELEAEDEEWIYPCDKFDSPQEQVVQPFNFSCKFCGLKLQALVEDQKEYFKDIVCFEMRKEGRKFSQRIPCFHLKDERQIAQGLCLLHKECFIAIYKGKIDESKWKLE